MSDSQNDQRHTLIVGGGIIGIACAHFLTAVGRRVTVIDQGKIGAECSHGNCGLISPSHVLPLNEPGAVINSIKAMFQRNGPLRFKPRFSPALWRWMWRFAKRCNHQDMLESGRAIHPLLVSSAKLYEQLVTEYGIKCEWQKRGLLFAYKEKSAFDAYKPINDLLVEKFNEPARAIGGDELVEFEPALKKDLAGAWFFEDDAHLRPNILVASWRAQLESKGVEFIEQCELQKLNTTAGASVSPNCVTSVTAGGRTFDVDDVVIATGARTPLLEKHLGYRAPIEPGKGYSITLPRPVEHCPIYPMIFPETRVAVTPMDSGLRLGSTIEFAGYDSKFDQKRLSVLTTGAQPFLKAKIEPTFFPEQWFGWRPMTFDSTPIIAKAPHHENVFLATGHNMLGLSMATGTGKLISELVTGVTPHLEMHGYRIR
jgi:D-amino-acid dehydrogenase